MPTYKVKQGDSWERIAGEVYGGDQRQFLRLIRANPDIQMLKKGMIINLPAPQENPYISQAAWNANIGADQAATATAATPGPAAPTPGIANPTQTAGGSPNTPWLQYSTTTATPVKPVVQPGPNAPWVSYPPVTSPPITYSGQGTYAPRPGFTAPKPTTFKPTRMRSQRAATGLRNRQKTATPTQPGPNAPWIPYPAVPNPKFTPNQGYIPYTTTEWGPNTPWLNQNISGGTYENYAIYVPPATQFGSPTVQYGYGGGGGGGGGEGGGGGYYPTYAGGNEYNAINSVGLIHWRI